jgi:hypothetical protein
LKLKWSKHLFGITHLSFSIAPTYIFLFTVDYNNFSLRFLCEAIGERERMNLKIWRIEICIILFCLLTKFSKYSNLDEQLISVIINKFLDIFDMEPFSIVDCIENLWNMTLMKEIEEDNWIKWKWFPSTCCNWKGYCVYNSFESLSSIEEEVYSQFILGKYYTKFELSLLHHFILSSKWINRQFEKKTLLSFIDIILNLFKPGRIFEQK